MSSGSLASDAWKAWAEPWKLARMLGGRPMSRAARSIAATAWPSATPGARLKDSVTAGNWPWWLTASAARVAGIRGLDRVLVLRAAHAVLDREVLHGLHEERDAVHRGELGLQATDHVAGADPAVGQRLQVDLDAAAVGGGVDPVDADERGEALDGRVAEDHGRQRLLAIRHRGEGDRRWRLGDAEDHARVLHGEEALRYDHVEDNGGDQCSHRDHERRGLALQHPAQRRAVAVDERFEEPFRGAVEAALLAAAPEQARAHHRR